MKGSIHHVFENGNKNAMFGVNIRDIGELLMDSRVVRVRYYNDASTDYERQADGTWTRTSGEHGKRRTVKVEAYETSAPGAFSKTYSVRVVKSAA